MAHFNAARISTSKLGTNNLEVIFVERPGKTLTVNLSPEAQNQLILAILARGMDSTGRQIPPRVLIVHDTNRTQFDTSHPLGKNHASLDISAGQNMAIRLAIPTIQLTKFQQEVAGLKGPDSPQAH